MIVYGVNPVAEALKAGRVKRLLVGRREDQRLQRLLALASRHGVSVERVEPGELDRRSRDGVHQGVVAEVSAAREYSVGDLVQDAGGPALLVVLDGIEDPHNVGAILRSVDASGAHGVIRQTRRAAALDTVAAKASAGAVSHVPVADVVNISRAPMLDRAALLDALRADRLGGFAADVWWEEPADPADPLLAMPSVILTPHIAADTAETEQRLAELTADNVRRIARGDAPRYVVDVDVDAGQ